MTTSRQHSYELLQAKSVADLTLVTKQISPAETHRYGMLSIDENQRIQWFAEKPEHTGSTLASLGYYVFNTACLLRMLEENAQDPASAHDIGWNLIPRRLGSGRGYACPFNGYWEQFKTLKAYWKANLAL